MKASGSQDGDNEAGYVGLEQLSAARPIDQWNSHKYWPSRFVEKEGGGEKQVKEKADLHGTSVFIRRRMRRDSTLKVQYAVFLPLGEPEVKKCPGEWSYTLFLHGFFFVDSGRTHIEEFVNLRPNLTLEEVTSESEIIQFWNRTLMKEVVAPLVLSSLDAFVRQEQLEPAEAESLVGALQDSKTLKKLNDWMCRGQRFIHRLSASGSRWVLESCPTEDGELPRWVELPAPEFLETDLFRLLPALTDLSSRVSISFKGKPRLADDKPKRLNDAELAELLGGVAVSAFADARQLDYLQKLIPEDAEQRGPDSTLTTSLVRLANQLVSHRLPEDEKLSDLWRKFFKRFPAKTFISLPCDSTKAVPEIARVLAEANLPVALLWQDFPQVEGDEGEATVVWDQLVPLLRQLGVLNFADETAVKQLSDIVVQLLKACEGQPSDWPDAIGALPLFHVREVGGTTVSASISNLRTSHAEERLFTGKDDWANDLVKAALGLKPLFLAGTVAKLLGISAPACEGTICVKLLRKAARLAADFASRKPLFDRILAVADRAGVGDWSALRCLLHGDLSAWEQTDKLFREGGDNAVFVRLVRQALDVAGQSWRFIPSLVAAQLALNADQEQQLNLSATSAKNVEGLLKVVGPERVDCADLSREECGFLLLQFNDVDVLRGLNIHETIGPETCRVRIEGHTYVDDGKFSDLPPEFDHLVTRIRPNPGYARFTSPELVPTLGWEAVIRIALEQPQPESYCDTILTAVGKLGTLRTELKVVVFDSLWVKMADGTAVAPSQLLHVPGADAELDQLPPQVLCDRVPLQRLEQAVREHDSFKAFKRTVLPPVQGALKAVAGLLTPHHPSYATGLSGEWSSEQTSDWVQTLGVPDGELSKELAVAPLAKALHGEQRVCEYLRVFLQALGGELSPSVYAVVLKHLIARHKGAAREERLVLERVFLRYLKVISDAGARCALDVLKADGVMLLNEREQWKPPGKLAFQTNGIVAEEILCRSHADALSVLELDANALLPVQADGANGDEAFAQALAGTKARVREYFRQWSEVHQEVIGAFLSVLGNAGGMRDLAQELLGQRNLNETRQAIAALAPVQTSQSLVENIANFQFACVVLEGETMSIYSVLGETFVAHLGGEKETIFLGTGVRSFPRAGSWHRRFLHLLAFDASGLDASRLAKLLRASTEAILSCVFSQRRIDLDPLWEKLSKPSQLHIRIAQNLVVDAALAFLRQIGAEQNADVRRVLKEWDDARRQIAEAEENGSPVPPTHDRLQKAKQELRALLTTNALTQTEMLAGVRRKIGEFQYSGSSVPFEVWQNADDAVAELERLGLSSERANELGFVVLHSKEVVAFAHWGRPLNEFQGSEGLNLRSAGFDRDLEKMLVQAISDKGDSAQQGGPALTGNFGLGFKSVFLVSDAPEILSGSVDFVIRGGIYPVRLEDGKRKELLSLLQAVAPNDERRGTVIRLPLRAGGQANADDVLRLFRQLAPILVIFSRRLKRLRFLEEGNLKPSELQWQPKKLLAGQCEFGKLPEPLGGVTGALTLHSAPEAGGNRLTFLLGLSHDGFSPLPSHVPVFWVTAPTRATPGYGFAVNGPFEPDVGRVQLASESEKNERLAKDLSEVVSARLAALWNRAEADWEEFRRELNLGSGVSLNSVWESLWKVLGVHFSEKCRKDDKSVVAELARCVLWESDASGMRHFYAAWAALPTGLLGKHRKLTKLGKVQLVTSGALDRKAVFETVSGWTGFKQRVAVGAICSGSQVASVLERLGAPLREAKSVHLATVVDWELGTETRADPKTAAHLGELITPEFMTKLEKGQAGEREESEHKRLVELLRDVSFQAAEGSWHKASKLVVSERATSERATDVTEDEVMRAAFSPRECQLKPAYTGPALQFFLASRPRLEAGVEQMAEWVLKAKDQATQIAALRYLLEGADHLRYALAASLRSRWDPERWLWNLESFDWFRTKFSEDQRHEILAHILKLFEERLRKLTGAGEEQRSDSQQQQEPKHIWTVEELWKWWEQQSKPTAEYTLEGEPNWRLFHGGPIRSVEERKVELKRLLLSAAKTEGKTEGNALWYRLFGYACLLSAGRYATELQRFWTARLDPQAFWECTGNGDFSEETREIFEQAVTAEFDDLNAGGEQAYFWRRVFYDIRKIHRMVWVNNFPTDLMRLVEEGYGKHLPHFLRTGYLPGPDQQRWVGTFGQSAGSPLFFVIRELVRLEVIKDKEVGPLAFFVSTPVRRALRKIGWRDEDDNGTPDFQELAGLSQWLHDKLMQDPHFGPLFLKDFDIPLLHMGITHRGNSMPVLPH